VTVVAPDGQREEVRMTLDAQVSRWTYPDTPASGVYRVELGPPLAREEAFAVNVDTAESDLTRLPGDELPREFTIYRRENLDEGELPAIGQRSGLHKLLLYGALGLLLCESFLAWRFARAT
jgi:hypothetical protein